MNNKLRKGLQDIRTRSSLTGDAENPQRKFLRVASLELKKSLCSKVRDAARKRSEEMDRKIADLESEEGSNSWHRPRPRRRADGPRSRPAIDGPTSMPGGGSPCGIEALTASRCRKKELMTTQELPDHASPVPAAPRSWKPRPRCGPS